MQVHERELTERLLWLCRLRWLAAAGILGLTLLFDAGLGFPLPVTALVLVGLAVVAYNVVLYSWTGAERRPDGTLPRFRATLLAHVQIGVDLVALAFVIHLTGGVESPLGAYLVFHMIIASTLLSPPAALFQATVASALYVAVAGAEYLNLLPHYSLGFFRPDFHHSWHAGLSALALLSVLYGATYLATNVVARLRLRERELAELTRRLEEEMARTRGACEQLEATQQMQVHYMRRVSHELRRPLAAVVSLLRVVLDELGGGESDPRLVQVLQRAVRRLRQGLDLVADLLVLSQAREAPLQEPRAWLDLPRLVEQVHDELADRAAQLGVTLQAEVAPDLAPLWAQPEGLSTVLLNLAGNALKYTPAGGTVTVRAEQDDTGTRLSVTDTGIGIPPEDLPRVFEEFFRSREARELDEEGTGLGLSIVQTIVGAQGGTCEVTSTPGQGSTFTCRLPARYPETDA